MMRPFSERADQSDPQARPQPVPTARLQPADSPRLAGVNAEHVRHLAGVAAGLPPILVHRRTMRVIDGMHRLQAAKLRGATEIEAVFFDGDESEAFIRAVKENTAHGLPLSLTERKAAALRILKTHPDWSDRSIGQVVRLSPKTVGAIRHDRSAGIPAVRTRLGRDGRQRRLREANAARSAGNGAGTSPSPRATAAAGPAAGAERMVLNPGRTQREVVVTMTPTAAAQLVRRQPVRYVPGPAPAPAARATYPGGPAGLVPRQAARSVARQPSGGPQPRTGSSRDVHALMQILSRDPSLRLNDSGRDLLRCLITRAVEPGDWDELAAAVPPHCAEAVMELATAYARAWADLAEQMERTSRGARSAAGAAGLLGAPSRTA
ncbi:MAG TPA: ParB/RepB/Spo0J family partition protein [Actinocrinis sp.]|nr:ParB/RepB/Spo0J family partition protein [Actinocrinis sp.]